MTEPPWVSEAGAPSSSSSSSPSFISPPAFFSEGFLRMPCGPTFRRSSLRASVIVRFALSCTVSLSSWPTVRGLAATTSAVSCFSCFSCFLDACLASHKAECLVLRLASTASASEACLANHSAECFEALGAGLGEGLIFLALSCCCGWSWQPTLQMVAGQLPSEQLLRHHESDAMASLTLRHSESPIALASSLEVSLLLSSSTTGSAKHSSLHMSLGQLPIRQLFVHHESEMSAMLWQPGSDFSPCEAAAAAAASPTGSVVMTAGMGLGLGSSFMRCAFFLEALPAKWASIAAPAFFSFSSACASSCAALASSCIFCLSLRCAFLAARFACICLKSTVFDRLAAYGSLGKSSVRPSGPNLGIFAGWPPFAATILAATFLACLRRRNLVAFFNASRPSLASAPLRCALRIAFWASSTLTSASCIA